MPAQNAGPSELHHMPRRSAIVAGALLALYIGQGSPRNGTAALGAASSPSQARPIGWSPATHGNQARPDYAGLFALHPVHELRISIDAATFRAMGEDLTTVLPFGSIASRFAGASSAPAGVAGGGMFGSGGILRLRDPCYFPVTVTHDGHEWTHVGMRYKGNFSLMMGGMLPDGKRSFRLNFDRFEDDHREIANQRFYGFKELTFSSNFDDASGMREALAAEIFRDRGVPAPRVAFYRIVVNTGSGDESWGLYTLVEDPADPAMLTSQFGGASGNLYKPDGPGADWTTFDRAGFEKKTNKGTADFSDIQAAIEALHADLPACYVARQSRAALRRRRLPALARGESGRRQLGRLRPFRAQLLPLRGSRKAGPPRLDTLGQQLRLRLDPIRGEVCRHVPGWRGACTPRSGWSAAWSDRTTTCCSRTWGRAGR